MERRIKRSVSLAIMHGHQLLVVQRPEDDEDLPNAWGLPAASLRENESWHDAARRAGCEKLGVELEIERELNRGSLKRKRYMLEMRLFLARITSGTPSVPQPDATVTQYHDWKWGSGEDLRAAARDGSLCSSLFLEWTAPRKK
jgi:ADP-ribose pyrophosphatase YjhB (NUDIX family)